MIQWVLYFIPHSVRRLHIGEVHTLVAGRYCVTDSGSPHSRHKTRREQIDGSLGCHDRSSFARPILVRFSKTFQMPIRGVVAH